MFVLTADGECAAGVCPPGRMYEVFRALPSADWHLVFFFFPFLNASATLLVNYVTSCGKYLVVPLCMCVLMFPTTFLYKQNHEQKMCMEFPTVVASPGPDCSFLCLLEAVVTPGCSGFPLGYHSRESHVTPSVGCLLVKMFPIRKPVDGFVLLRLNRCCSVFFGWAYLLQYLFPQKLDSRCCSVLLNQTQL